MHILKRYVIDKSHTREIWERAFRLDQVFANPPADEYQLMWDAIADARKCSKRNLGTLTRKKWSALSAGMNCAGDDCDELAWQIVPVTKAFNHGNIFDGLEAFFRS